MHREHRKKGERGSKNKFERTLYRKITALMINHLMEGKSVKILTFLRRPNQYRCETWSLTEKHNKKIQVFNNKWKRITEFFTIFWPTVISNKESK